MAYYTHNYPSYPPYAPQTRQDAFLLVQDASVVVEGLPLSPHECPDSRSCLSSLACSPTYTGASTVPQAAYDTALCLSTDSGHYDASPTSSPIVDLSRPYPDGQVCYGDASTLTQDSSVPHLYHGITVSIVPRTSLDHSSVYTDAAATQSNQAYGRPLELSVDRDQAYSFQYTSQTQQDTFLFAHDASTSPQVALPSHVSYGSPEYGSSVTSSHYSPVSMDAAILSCEGYGTGLNMSVGGGQGGASLIPSITHDQSYSHPDDRIYCGNTFISAQSSVDIPSPLGSLDSTTSQDALGISPGHFDVTALQHAAHNITVGYPHNESPRYSPMVHDPPFHVDDHIYPPSQTNQSPVVPDMGSPDAYWDSSAAPVDLPPPTALGLVDDSNHPSLHPSALFEDHLSSDGGFQEVVSPIPAPFPSPEPCQPSPSPSIAQPGPMNARASRAHAAAMIAEQFADLSLNAPCESASSASSDEYVPLASPARVPASGAARARTNSPRFIPYPRPSQRFDSPSSSSPPASRSPAAVSPPLSPPSVVPSNGITQFHRTPPRNRQCPGKKLELPEGSRSCPECGYRPPKEWPWELRRHIACHFPDEPKALCGGLPYDEAVAKGIDVGTCKTYTWKDVVYYGGCLKEFSRWDSVRRHLRATANTDRMCVSRRNTPYNVARLGPPRKTKHTRE